MNFSSNIFAHADLSELKNHLCRNIHLIDNYPEPESYSLERLIAEKKGLSQEEVLVTNGATEAIYLVAQAFASRGGAYFSTGPWPTFCEYGDASRMAGLLPLARKGVGDPVDTSGVSPDSDTMLWLCNPNNPDGRVYAESEIASFARRFALVVVDQSYEDFTLAPMMSPRAAAAYDNVVQLHSLTKTYAVPGLRVGYVTANPGLIALLRGYVRPWSVNALAVEAGKWLLEHDVKAVPCLKSYLDETQRLCRQLGLIPDIAVQPTQSSFILAEIATMRAAELKDALARDYHILIRDASNFQGLTPHHFRVSTQTREENNLLVDAIGNVVARSAK